MIARNDEASAYYGRRIWTVELNALQLDSDEVRALAEILNGAGDVLPPDPGTDWARRARVKVDKLIRWQS